MSPRVARDAKGRSAQSSTDLVASTRAQIEQRLKELRPLASEVTRLEQALAALQAIEDRPASQSRSRSPARRRPGRPRGRRGSGTRADQFLALARERPGITVAEAAKAIGVAPNYLYRIAASLEREGTVRREGRGFVAPGTEGPAAPEQPGEGVPAPTGVALSPPESET